MRITPSAVVALSLALYTGVLVPPVRAEISAAVSFDFFYSNLSPHGSWIVSSQYGRVWQPNVYRPDWNPYYDGHWAYADVGWTWVSDYPWGAIPYHYGTWMPDPAIGWVWVPGYTWAPAWVVFRTGPDYIGWAPVAPSFSLGMSFGGTAPVSGSFLFVSTRDFCAPRIRTLVLPEAEARRIVTHTTIVNNLVVQNNLVVNRGPDVRAVETATGRKIQVAHLEDVPRVAPFGEVHRQQLAIAPERARHQVRAAEPVSARQVIPQGKDVAQLNHDTAREGSRVAPPAPRASSPGPSGVVEKRPARDVKPPKAQDTGKPPQSRKKEPQKKHDPKQNEENKDDQPNDPS